MNKDYKLSVDDYNKMAGSDWPSYSEYFQGKLSKRMALEIGKHEKKFYEVEQQAINQTSVVTKTVLGTVSLAPAQIFKIIFDSILPAIAAIWLFVYLGGTIEKFVFLFFLFRIKKEFWIMIVHKWFCHNQFEPKRWARPILLFIVVAGARTPTGQYVQDHWAHHKYQDTELDPYPSNWGLLNLILFSTRSWRKYPFGRWMVAPDIKFVLRNQFWLRLIYWSFIAIIDLDILIISFFFMNFYDRIIAGVESYLYHDGFHTQRPIDNYPFIGYPIMLFMGSAWLHQSHVNKPWQFDCGKSNPNLIDLEYHLLKFFAAKERE